VPALFCAAQLHEQFGIKPLLGSQRGKNKSWCICRTKTHAFLIPCLPQALRYGSAPSFHTPAAVATGHMRKGKQGSRLSDVGNVGGGSVFPFFPATELSVHEDVAITQLSVLLLSSVPLSSFPGPKPASAEQKTHQLHPSNSFRFTSFLILPFASKRKYRIATQIKLSPFLKSRRYSVASPPKPACFIQTDRGLFPDSSFLPL